MIVYLSRDDVDFLIKYLDYARFYFSEKVEYKNKRADYILEVMGKIEKAKMKDKEKRKKIEGRKHEAFFIVG